jgi:microcystin-dependent protein
MDEYIGIIKIFGGNFAPRGWQMCNGQQLSISQNSALFSILGTTYGGNGQTTFALPNFQSRVPIGMGQGAGLASYVEGQTGGFENTTLTIPQMPAHNHTATFNPTGGGGASGGAAVVKASTLPATESTCGTAGANTLAACVDSSDNSVKAYVVDANPTVTLGGVSGGGGGGITGGTITVGITGNSLPVPLIQPYIAVNYIICIEGLFPSRN